MLKWNVWESAVSRRIEAGEPRPHPIDIFERGTDMKYILILSILAALLGGCAIVPAGYGDHRDGYSYRERGYNRGDGNYRDRYYYQGDGNYRDYGYRR
jgi:hypothetical protein